MLNKKSIITILLTAATIISSSTDYYALIIKKNYVETSDLESPHKEHVFIETDWKNSGDKKVTLDTSTGLEWLDFTETAGLPYNTTIPGFRKPTSQEIDTLLEHFFPIILSVEPVNGNYNAISHEDQDGVLAESAKWHSLFGTTETGFSAGLVKENGHGKYIGVNLSGYIITHHTSNSVDHFLNGGYNPGVMFVSDGGATLSSINDPSINVPVQ